MCKNKITFLCLDIGNFFGKLYTEGEGGEPIKDNYENRFVLDNNAQKLNSEYLTFEGNTYFFNIGLFDREYSKVKKNILNTILYLIGKAGVDGIVDIMLFSPVNQINKAREEFKNQLQDKEFKFEVNGSERNIKIRKVGVLEEGFAAFYSLDKRNDGLLCMIDIGGRSTDVFCFVDGRKEIGFSIPVGTIDLFEWVSDKIIEEGKKCTAEDIDKYLEAGIIDINDYEQETLKLYESIVNYTKTKIDINDYNIFLCGGGAEYLLKHFQKDYTKKVNISNDPIFANVKGGYRIGTLKGFGKAE